MTHKHDWHLAIRMWTPDKDKHPWDDVQFYTVAVCWEEGCDAELDWKEIERRVNAMEPNGDS